MTLIELRKMELHSCINDGDMDITRVPHGWLYSIYSHEITDEYGSTTPIMHPPVFVSEVKSWPLR